MYMKDKPWFITLEDGYVDMLFTSLFPVTDLKPQYKVSCFCSNFITFLYFRLCISQTCTSISFSQCKHTNYQLPFYRFENILLFPTFYQNKFIAEREWKHIVKDQDLGCIISFCTDQGTMEVYPDIRTSMGHYHCQLYSGLGHVYHSYLLT